MTVDLVIAGRRIRLCSGEGVIIRPDERFSAFTVPDVPDLQDVPDVPVVPVTQAGGQESGQSVSPEPDLLVDVDPGPGEIPASAAKVFDARLMEEVPGGVRDTGEQFWEIFAGPDADYARVYLQDSVRIPVLVMPHGAGRWQIYAGGDTGPAASSGRETYRKGLEHGDDPEMTVNPLPYPLDGLLLYFLFSKSGDIMIHGSGVITGPGVVPGPGVITGSGVTAGGRVTTGDRVNTGGRVKTGGRGWLFTGRSGSGKTTMARIFDRAGDRVIHDDRLVLRREGGQWVMHNTPVYRNDEPRSAVLEHLWLIRHGAVNVSEPVAGAEAVAMILANCIQQNWDGEAASGLAAAVDDLAASVKVSRLSFVPDGSVRDYLLLRATAEKELVSGAVLSLLDEGRSVTVTAGGYSMWPAIRPGDAVVIGPCGESVAAAGQVVALRRDGGFVLHRVTRVMSVSGRQLIVTCGDAAVRADDPAGPETVAGVVKYIIRSGRQFPPPRRRWPRRINRMTGTIAGWVRG